MSNVRVVLHLIMLIVAIISFTVYFDQPVSQLFVLGSVFLIGISAIKYRELLPFFLILLLCEMMDKSMGIAVSQYSIVEFKEVVYVHPLPFLLTWYLIIDTICRMLIMRGHNSNALRAWLGVTTKVRELPQIKAFYGLLGLEIILSASVLVEWNLNSLGWFEPYFFYQGYPYVKTALLILKTLTLWSLVIDTSFYYRLHRDNEVSV